MKANLVALLSLGSFHSSIRISILMTWLKDKQHTTTEKKQTDILGKI